MVWKFDWDPTCNWINLKNIKFCTKNQAIIRSARNKHFFLPPTLRRNILWIEYKPLTLLSPKSSRHQLICWRFPFIYPQFRLGIYNFVLASTISTWHLQFRLGVYNFDLAYTNSSWHIQFRLGIFNFVLASTISSWHLQFRLGIYNFDLVSTISTWTPCSTKVLVSMSSYYRIHTKAFTTIVETH